MLNARLFGCVLALSLSILGCGGGGGTSPGFVEAPSSLTVRNGDYAGSLVLSWKAPSQAIAGYDLEGKPESDAAFKRLFNELIPSNYTALQLYFQTIPPEGARYVFRLRATAGGQYSSYSNEVVYEQGPDSPTNLVATYDFDQKAVSLSWTRNSLTSDNCRLERATSDQYGQNTGTWTVLNGVGPAASAFADISVEVNTNYVYRLKNLKGTVESAPVTSSVIYTGVPAVSYLSAYYDSSQECAALAWSWSTYSTPTQVKARIERAESDASGLPIGVWTSMGMVDASTRTFNDRSLPEVTYLLYRITPVAGSFEGLPVQAPYTIQTPLLAPTNLRLTPSTQGFRLDWDNRSQLATEIVIRRTPSPNSWSDGVALLGSSTTSYEDLGLALGYYNYQVVARRGSTESRSVGMTAAMLNPANSLQLVAGAAFPTLTCGVVRPNGGWALGVQSPFGVRSDSVPWPAFFPPDGFSWNRDFVRVDALGNPHAVYVKVSDYASGLYTIVHAWFDGIAWQKEDVATTNLVRDSAFSGLEFALDSNGALHLLLDHSTDTAPYGGSLATLSYLHKSDGAYVAEPLSTFLDAAVCNTMGSYHIQVDAQGLPHVLLGTFATVVDCARGNDGKWQVSTLPTGTVYSGWYDFLDSHWVDANNGWVFYESYLPSDTLHYAWMGLQLKDGIWQTPGVILKHDGTSTLARVVMSQDGSRILVHERSRLGERLFHFQEGAWVGTLLAPQGGYGPIPMGFDSDRKFHLLLPFDYAGTQYQEYREP